MYREVGVGLCSRLLLEKMLVLRKLMNPLGIDVLSHGFQSANLGMRSGAIAPGNQLTAPDKHKNVRGRALKTALVYYVNEI
jgi:hypothetical protein